MSTYKFQSNIKITTIFIALLLSSCTQSTFSGYVYDFDTGKPLKNVTVYINGNLTKTDSIGHFEIEVNSNSNCIINLKRQGYANKNIVRKPDYLEKTKSGKLKNSTVYMFKSESDFSK